MSMESFNGENFPPSMGDEEKRLYKILLISLEAITGMSNNKGISDSMVISMVMSAHMTFLVNKLGCQHCVAEILADAAHQLGEGEAHQGDSKVERAAKMSVHKVKNHDGTVH